jgi:hypothetical protein
MALQSCLTLAPEAEPVMAHLLLFDDDPAVIPE